MKVTSRILMVGPSLEAPGGISSVMQTLLDSELSSLFDIEIAVTTGFGSGPRARLWELGYLMMACASILSGRPLVHIHMASGGSFFRKSVVLWWAKLWGRKTLIHLHGSQFHHFALRDGFTRWMVRQSFRAADAVAVLSPEWQDRILEITGRTDTIVVPNPVFVPSRPTVGTPGIVFLGRLGARKGTPELVAAVSILQSRGLIVPVVIAGDGDVDGTRAAVASLPDPHAVAIPGWVSQETVAGYLANYAVFCLPSFDEGKPVALLQAMGYGLTCVTTPVGGIPDVVKDGVNGLLVPAGDSEALAAALERALTDNRMATTLGENARRIVQSEYDVTVVASRLKQVYEALGATGSSDRTRPTDIHAARAIYERLPESVRSVVGALARLLPSRLRYGKLFTQSLREIKGMEFATRSEHEFAQERLLGRLVAHAARSPYWREVFVQAGLPNGPRSVDELIRLPLLDKETVRMNHGAMVTEGGSASRRKWVTTGGTSGRPLGLWIDKDASVRDWAFVINAWSRVGFKLDEKRVVLRGRRLGEGARRKLFNYEPLRRELYVSTFDLDTDHLPRIRRVVRGFKSRYIHGYPSAMEVLGRSFRDADEATPPLQALLAVSENLYPGQRELLEQLYGSRVFSLYGMTEKGGFAAECEQSTELHVEPLYGYVELIDEQGCRITDADIRGEITVTGFLSLSMPLIRYRTGDFGSWSSGECACGRQHQRLRRIDGRWTQEYLVTNSGSRISMTALNVHSSVFDSVRRLQFLQEAPGVVTLLIEPTGNYTDSDTAAIASELGSKLKDQIEVAIELVEHVPQTLLGKHRFIDQRLPESP